MTFYRVDKDNFFLLLQQIVGGGIHLYKNKFSFSNSWNHLPDDIAWA